MIVVKYHVDGCHEEDYYKDEDAEYVQNLIKSGYYDATAPMELTGFDDIEYREEDADEWP